MKQKISCFCGSVFSEDIDEEINLSRKPEYLKQIIDGTFLNFTCSNCGKKHKPEFPLSVLWPSKKLRFEVFPELGRGEFYRKKKAPADKGPNAPETIIGYPEMADRLAVIRDGFEPLPVEAIKYFLHLKAEEQYPDGELDIWYFGFSSENESSGEQASLEFHIHGMRENEVAVMKVPLSLYQKTLADYRENPKNEVFATLRIRNYLSVKNAMVPEALK